MSKLLNGKEGTRYLVMGNEAIARGALEAGVNVASGYPGTPSAEIIEQLAGVAKDAGIYTEWSVNEKVALEVAASASFAELRSMAVMKQNGVNVASDFLLHLAISGTRGGMVLVACEDPGALSSQNEGDSRTFARLVEIPLLEPGDFQEAKDMTKWAFELSEKIGNIVLLRIRADHHANRTMGVDRVAVALRIVLGNENGRLLPKTTVADQFDQPTQSQIVIAHVRTPKRIALLGAFASAMVVRKHHRDDARKWFPTGDPFFMELLLEHIHPKLIGDIGVISRKLARRVFE